MRKIMIAALLLAQCALLSAQDIDSELKIEKKLYPKTKQVEWEYSKLPDGTLQGESRHYNKISKVLDGIMTYENGILTRYQEIFPNGDVRCSIPVEKGFSNGGAVMINVGRTEMYVQNADGRTVISKVIETLKSDMETPVLSNIEFYDENGKLKIKMSGFPTFDKGWQYLAYDKNGKITKDFKGHLDGSCAIKEWNDDRLVIKDGKLISFDGERYPTKPELHEGVENGCTYSYSTIYDSEEHATLESFVKLPGLYHIPQVRGVAEFNILLANEPDLGSMDDLKASILATRKTMYGDFSFAKDSYTAKGNLATMVDINKTVDGEDYHFNFDATTGVETYEGPYDRCYIKREIPLDEESRVVKVVQYRGEYGSKGLKRTPIVRFDLLNADEIAARTTYDPLYRMYEFITEDHGYTSYLNKILEFQGALEVFVRPPVKIEDFMEGNLEWLFAYNRGNAMMNETGASVKYTDLSGRTAYYYGKGPGTLTGRGLVSIPALGGYYEGDLVDGRREGNGTFQSYAYDYEGAWDNDKFEGQGKIKYSNGCTYEGGWHQDLQEGKGSIVYADGSTYDGEWKAGKFDGQGKRVFANGDVFEGTWDMGRCRQGKMTYADGRSFEGGFKNNHDYGDGVWTLANGEKVTALWQDGAVKGYEIDIVFANGDTYKGGWQNNSFDRAGTYTWADGRCCKSEAWSAGDPGKKAEWLTKDGGKAKKKDFQNWEFAKPTFLK